MITTVTTDNEDIIMVKVGEREFETAIDSHGVQRFLPHDQTPKRLLDLMKEWDDFVKTMEVYDKIPEDMYTPNDLNSAFHRGEWTVDELLSYQTNSEYSVAGFSTLSAFYEMEISNPLWEEE